MTDASTGEAVRTDPLYVRAQLASLLREVGLTDEAKQEGEAVFAQLIARGSPPLTSDTSRNPIRALARAAEGAGNDREALHWYGEFVRFGSQIANFTDNRCTWCHAIEGPKTMAFFRDWWAGKKFAEYATKTGSAPALIASHEATLSKSPNNVAAQLSLAYLYEATGDSSRSQQMWKNLEP